MEGGDSEFAKFTLPALKGIFEGPKLECVWQQAITYVNSRMLKTNKQKTNKKELSLPLQASTTNLLIIKKEKRKKEHT